MRLHLAFALLVIALAGVTGWALWRDAFPEWRAYQREWVRREIVRLEAELDSVRAELGRPEVRYELARLDLELEAAAADTSAPAVRLSRIRARLDSVQTETDAMRRALREGERRLREPALAERRREITSRLEQVQQAYARATGTWPPDTLRLRRLWSLRDSLAGVLIRIEGPIERLRDSLQLHETEAQQLRLAAVSLTSARDSLESARSRLLEPAMTRESALARLRGHRDGIREIVSLDGKEVARCPTCHGAMDDAPGAHPPLPAMEVFRDVPCTVCHRGSGRALDVKDAHRRLLSAAGFGAGPYSLRARIERLSSRDPRVRERAREELWQITGADPGPQGGPERAGDPDSAAAAAWAEWWRKAEPYFEPGDTQAGDLGDNPLLAVGIDPWIFSVRGRPLRYVGSAKCLSCHEVRHREHSRRWIATKFKSLERLVDQPNPEPCFACHATGYDPATGTYAEPGVTCEGCHGPGERYNEMMVVGQELVDRGDETRGNALLDHSSRLAREAVSRRTAPGPTGEVNVCVTCHHPWEHRDGGPGFLEREKPPSPGGEKGKPIAVGVGD